MDGKVGARDQHLVDRGFKLGIRSGTKVIVGPYARRLKRTRETTTEQARRRPSV